VAPQKWAANQTLVFGGLKTKWPVGRIFFRADCFKHSNRRGLAQSRCTHPPTKMFLSQLPISKRGFFPGKAMHAFLLWRHALSYIHYEDDDKGFIPSRLLRFFSTNFV
jgi:hypothetical protein